MIHVVQRFFNASLVLMLGLLVGITAGCGGSGAGAGGGAAAQASEAAQISVTTSAPQIASSGAGTVTITAFVKDAGNRTMSGEPVVFSTTDAGAALTVVDTKTTASGSATATLGITDKSNRSITVTAVSGSLSGSVAVNVTGTSLSLSGPSNVVFGAATTYTAQLRDSDGKALAARTIAITSAAGNTLSASSVVTDATGQATFTVTGALSGADTLTLTGLGATTTLAINVSGTQLNFSAPTENQELVVGNLHNVTVTFIDSGVAQVGQTIQFAATRGTLSAPSAVTDATGTATVTLSATTAGISTVMATAPNGAVSTRKVEFVSVTPAKMTVQSSPSTVAVNLSTSGTNSSNLIAVVRDANDNPVKNVTVNFSTVADPSNGRIEPASAITDSNGIASVAFYPGANSTGNNQIIVQSTTTGVAPAQTTLTAAAQSISVRLGTGNETIKVDDTRNRHPFTGVVVDTNGSPVVDADIVPSLVAMNFYKGRYYWGGTAWYRGGATSVDSTFECPSEDVNENARMDAGEDTNGNTILDPTGVATVVVEAPNSKTDSSGFARLVVEYPRNYGGWVKVRLRLTITTLAGTEGFDYVEFVLPVLADDVTDQNVAPPGAISPFGVQPDCSNTN